MPEISIDGQKYDTDKMNEEMQAQVRSLQFVESEILRRNAELAVFQTARIAYAKALKAELDKQGQAVIQ